MRARKDQVIATLTGGLELVDVPESMLIVGGGYIGLELGTVYAALGSRVSVVELTDGLLPGVDRDLVKPLHKRLGEPMLAHKAAHEGKVAVEALAGEAAAFEPRAIPAVVFTDPEIAWAGLTQTGANKEGRRVEVAQFPWAASGRAQAVGRTEGMTKWLIDPASGRVVGCGIVGSGAGDLVSEAVLAIEMGAAVRDVADSIHPHPTLCETLAAAAEVHLGTATDLYRRRRKK